MSPKDLLKIRQASDIWTIINTDTLEQKLIVLIAINLLLQMTQHKATKLKRECKLVI